MSINYPTLAHFRHFRHFYPLSPSTLVEKALQIHSILTNKPKVKYAKINVNSFLAMRYENMDIWLFRQTKPIKAKTNPIQTQFDERPKLMQSAYIQRIMKKNAAMGPKKQSQFKSNSNPICRKVAI